MLTSQTKELLQRLRSGTLDVADASALGPLSSSGFLSDLRELYPVMFQERRIGAKHEVGLARSLRFELTVGVGTHPDSLFTPVSLLPVLGRCLFISFYDDAIAEITAAASLRVRPGKGASQEVVLKIGRGQKLDRTLDGWVLKPVKRRAVTLSEAFLAKRGWNFDALVPFSPKAGQRGPIGS